MFGLSLGHVIILLVLVLIIFGAGKLPGVMGELGKGVKAFKQGMEGEDEKPATKPTRKPAAKKAARKPAARKSTKAKKRR